MKSLRSLIAGTFIIAATLPALAVDTMSSADAPDLTAVRASIAAKDFKTAIADLNGLIQQGVQHPDIYNLLGYSLRKSGDKKTALSYYLKALEFDPDHKGALEYLGELYMEMGDMAKAEANRARLKLLCPQGCEELEDLSHAIAQASAKTN
ncbi:tetratricopeptide repeat protein [Taklimakanibacter deserti]|uniref:tetratricopeptide repeat protein n=1 Tax=Taklimakanibacter deserti TaxID=2267839 RepID=UPI000E655E90